MWIAESLTDTNRFAGAGTYVYANGKYSETVLMSSIPNLKRASSI
jgi:hypothetical protein